jgi:hypothetical protein
MFVACASIAPVMAAIGDGGWWDFLQRSIGVLVMHMQLLHNDPTTPNLTGSTSPCPTATAA